MANQMERYLWLFLFLLLLITMTSSLQSVHCEKQASQSQDNSRHDDHLNDESDGFLYDYVPIIIPVDSNMRIGVAPVITCTAHESDTWNPHYHSCKLAQTILIDNDWNDGDANYTYIFEDWTDYDWNDVIMSHYVSVSDGIFSDLLITFREADWKNPFSLEIATEGTWIKIEWNSTDYPSWHSLMVDEGETVKLDLFAESNLNDKATVRFLIPPFPSFSWQPAQPLVGETVVFDASASYDIDKEIETYSWIFGDDTSADTANQTIVHRFMSLGNYSVSLTVIDSDGMMNVVSQHIQVLAVIGGRTTALNDTLMTIWENVRLFLLIAFVAFTTLMRRNKKRPHLG